MADKINWRSRIVKSGKKAADQFTPHPLNPRRHPEFQRQVVSASLDELGQIAPVVENTLNGYLVDGEERIWQALSQGDDTPVDVIFVELSDEEHLRALELFDASGELAQYDKTRLQALIDAHPINENAALAKLRQRLEAKGDAYNYPLDEGAYTFEPITPDEGGASMYRNWNIAVTEEQRVFIRRWFVEVLLIPATAPSEVVGEALYTYIQEHWEDA